MKKLLALATFAALALASRADAQVVCTINNSLGCFAGGGGGVAAGDNTVFTGDNVFQGLSTFGTAADALDAIWFVPDGTLCFEGGTADGFETCITVTDPDVDSTLTIGYSPDGNPWIGAGAGDAAGASETDDLCLGENACGAMNGTATDNTCLGDNACLLLTTADNVVAVGADTLDAMTAGGGGYATALGKGALGLYNGVGGVGVGYLAGDTATTAQNVLFVGNAADTSVATAAGQIGVGANTITHGANAIAMGLGAEAGPGGVSVGVGAGDAQGVADVDSVYIGDSGGGAASGTSTDNSCVGDLCLASLTTGDRNLGLGANTDVGTNTDSDVTVIGESMVGKGSDTYLDGFGGRERCFTQGTGKALTESAPTAFVRISVASESYTGAWIRWRVLADDGVDFQALSGESVIDVVNKAAAETCVIRTIPAFGAAVEAASAGTLALEADPACATAAADTVDISLDAVSSLGQTSLNVFYTICIDGPITTMTAQ